MSPQQEEHLKEIVTVTKALIESKYREGQKKHGGNLFDLTASELIDEAIMECVDQMTYLLTAKSKLSDFKEYATRVPKTDIRSLGDIYPGKIIHPGSN
jgi:hypothetical protein